MPNQQPHVAEMPNANLFQHHLFLDLHNSGSFAFPCVLNEQFTDISRKEALKNPVQPQSSVFNIVIHILGDCVFNSLESCGTNKETIGCEQPINEFVWRASLLSKLKHCYSPYYIHTSLPDEVVWR